MTVDIDLPAPIADVLRRYFNDVTRATKEAALVEFYRQEILTHQQLAVALGISRLEVDVILRRHKLPQTLLTFDELFQPVDDVTSQPAQ